MLQVGSLALTACDVTQLTPLSGTDRLWRHTANPFESGTVWVGSLWHSWLAVRNLWGGMTKARNPTGPGTHRLALVCPDRAGDREQMSWDMVMNDSAGISGIWSRMIQLGSLVRQTYPVPAPSTPNTQITNWSANLCVFFLIHVVLFYVCLKCWITSIT